MQAQLVKAKGNYGARRLAGIALSPVLRIELIPDICLVRARRPHANTTVADQLPVTFQHQRELEFQARLLGLLVEKHAHEGPNLLWCAPRPLIIAQIAWVGLIR